MLEHKHMRAACLTLYCLTLLLAAHSSQLATCRNLVVRVFVGVHVAKLALVVVFLFVCGCCGFGSSFVLLITRIPRHRFDAITEINARLGCTASSITTFPVWLLHGAHGALPEPRVIVDDLDVVPIEQFLARFPRKFVSHIPLKVHIDGAVSFASGIRLLHDINSIDESNLQIAHRVEDCGLGWLATDGSECAWNADAGVCNWSLVFAIDVAGDILAILTNVRIVVGVTTGALILPFAGNIPLAVSVSVVALIVVVGVGVVGHFD